MNVTLKFNECRVNVLTQYYENYGDSQSPYWKPKGGHVFTFVVDSDMMIYSKELVLESLEKVLSQESNEYSRFEYVSHEVEFVDPVDITDRINQELKEEWWRRTHLEELHYETCGEE